ncbi:hypothetical protein GCM10027448_16140 [Nocardioides dilutus]
MAYDDSAANRIHSAETSSPRDSARTLQQTAPTTATAPQIAMDFGLIRGFPPGVLVRTGVVIDMADSSSVLRAGRPLRRVGIRSGPQHAAATRRDGSS